MFLMFGPERYSAPPVEIWMMPSLPASAKPCSAAFRVWEDDTLIAGKANDFAFAASSISAYFSGVAMGMRALLTNRRNVPTLDDLEVTVRSRSRGIHGGPVADRGHRRQHQDDRADDRRAVQPVHVRRPRDVEHGRRVRPVAGHRQGTRQRLSGRPVPDRGGQVGDRSGVVGGGADAPEDRDAE